MNDINAMFHPGELREKFTEDIISELLPAWVIWREEVLGKILPLTLDVNANDLLSTLLIWNKGGGNQLTDTLEVIRGPGGYFIAYSWEKDDYFWMMEIIGWSNNTTTVFRLVPWFPEDKKGRDQVINQYGDDYDKFVLAIDEACDIVDNLRKYFNGINPPAWLSKEMAKEIQQRNMNRFQDIEDALIDEPEVWLKIAKGVRTHMSDHEISKMVTLEESYVSKLLTIIRKKYPHLRLYRGSRGYTGSQSKEEVKKVKN